MATSDHAPRFSICVPNFNYGRFIGETISSVLAQEGPTFEIIVSDNCSTDDSVEVVESFNDPRISLHVNHTNIGMCPNIDIAARQAKGDIMIVLSSDDIMRPGALAAYDAIFAAEPDKSTVVTSTVQRIDKDSHQVGVRDVDLTVWKGATEDTELSAQIGSRTIQIPPRRLLRQCFVTMRNPFHFPATAYSRSLYWNVEGYLGSRNFGPDKWFHWRILAHAQRVLAVEGELFAYRWHDHNQAAIEANLGSLRFLVDDYLNTFETTDHMLNVGFTTREELEAAYIEYDIARHGLATLARGDHVRAQRIAAFGRSTYPVAAKHNRKMAILRIASSLGTAGAAGAKLALWALGSHLDTRSTPR